MQRREDSGAAGAGVPAAHGRANDEDQQRGERSVLVVDDNRDSLATMEMLLRLWGYEVTVAYDGPSALVLAKAIHPTVVLLDIGLPGMDGYEVARRMRADLGGVILIAVTGRSQESDRDRARAAGFDHHIVKPVEPAQLRRIVGGEDHTPAAAAS
jgi:CheY-like chemotaxis protein